MTVHVSIVLNGLDLYCERDAHSSAPFRSGIGGDCMETTDGASTLAAEFDEMALTQVRLERKGMEKAVS